MRIRDFGHGRRDLSRHDGHMAVLRMLARVCSGFASSLGEEQTDEVQQLKRNRRRSSDKADRTAAHGSDVKSLVDHDS
jgi:hypothetical protein